MPTRFPALLAAAALALAGCGGQGDSFYAATLQDGPYQVSSGSGYATADEAKLFAITATLDRAQGRLVLTLADGSTRTLALAYRPRSAWPTNCYTMASHYDLEAADVTPTPLALESMTFTSPLVAAMCWRGRLVLSNADQDISYALVLDRL